MTEKTLHVSQSIRFVDRFRVNGRSVGDHVMILHSCGRMVSGNDEALVDEAHRQHKRHCAASEAK